MPVPTLPPPHCETLANGLRISLHSAPHLTRCAAALRVAAGSHDAPQAWPGLAHFLEHLLFLGTERFPIAQGLMAFVQAQNGLLNASTQARTTDFFIELVPHAFPAALERLSDMLAHARLSLADQLREREVLHAEFIAWARDEQSQGETLLLNGLNAAHPLRAFHSGNRFSLPVPNPAFQQALRGFYEQFYRSAQMTLSLAGPQPLDELKALALRFAAEQNSGAHQPQTPPPPLMAAGQHVHPHITPRRLNLLFAGHAAPAVAAQALDFLCTWLNNPKPGGVMAQLQQRGWATTLSAAPQYQFGGQVLLHVGCELPADVDQRTEIGTLLLDWLAFLRDADWAPLCEEYALLQQCKRETAGALALSRLGVEPLQAHMSEAAIAALKGLLRQWLPGTTATETWHLPAPNPFLQPLSEAPRAGLIRGQTSAHRGLRTFAQDRTRGRREPSSLSISQALPSDGRDGALYLRWRLPAALAEQRTSALNQRLEPLAREAGQAGVRLELGIHGEHCLLTLSGRHYAFAAVLEQAIRCLDEPQAAPAHTSHATLMPLHHLARLLARHCRPMAPPSDGDLHSLWREARRDGLAVALPASVLTAISAILGSAPGIPDSQLDTPPSLMGEQRWSTVANASGEHALLLFCPAPTQDLADEAAWRALAQLCHSAFYQRLRVELQLGYGVFCGLRPFNGQLGIVFGVQSPHTPVAGILAHIEAFLAQLPSRIAALDDAALHQQLQDVAGHYDTRAMTLPITADLLWHARLAGHGPHYLGQLQTAILALDRHSLLAAARRLNERVGGWRCLASGQSPGAPWQTVAV